jgi:hypothetical protein
MNVTIPYHIVVTENAQYVVTAVEQGAVFKEIMVSQIARIVFPANVQDASSVISV